MNNIVISNPFIKKELYIKSGHIQGYSLTNIKSGRTVNSLSGSEEFLLVFRCGIRKISIKASDLKIEDSEKMTEGDIEKYIITFKSFSLRDSKIKVRLVYTVNDFRCYLRKHIELSFDKKGDKEIILDSIVYDKLSFDSSYKYWTLPKQKDYTVISGFSLSLGQPVYVDCFYFGCEFPVAINKIEKRTAKSAYYSGKKLSQLIGADSYISYKSVVGGADSDIFEAVQKAFYEYIKDISKPVYLRRQYNSWYDNMLNITRENITSSFLEIEKALTATGEPPLDSYVADDGWNDYSAPFWSFNENFPDELYPFRALAEGLGSRFGLWLGPRGGYTSDTIKFARKIQAAGNGYVNKKSMDICVGSKKYTDKTTELLLDFQKRFGINYFKLDGFAQKPCKCKKHDHLTGGYKDIYFYSDIWERWIKSFERFSVNGGSDFWINLTCYAWPSPWFLQWVNSLWMQISLDVGFYGKKGKSSDKDRMLSYRDELYFDFYRERQFQFPQRALYNHDPIYGKEAGVSMSDDEFREYLFTMATRGTQFWELYYSHSMMNDAKWRINYSCLRFIEENMNILANSVVFGCRPTDKGVYGFSCFGDNEGIVSLRNSCSYKQEYTLVLDELIGVSKSFSFGEMYTVLPYNTDGVQGAYSYKDKLTVTLEPYQTKILHFGKKVTEPSVVYAKAVGDNKLLLTFDQAINIKDTDCKENAVVKKELLEDYMSVILTFSEPFGKDNSYELLTVKEMTGKSFDIKVDFSYYADYIVDGGIKGDSDFTVEINLTKKEKGNLYRQAEELAVYVGNDDYIRFRIGSCVLKSAATAENAVQITAVRERNNVMKLYINKNLDSGIRSIPFTLSGAETETAEGVNVKILDRALSYDEV